jgi:hypothetical protein
MKHTIKLLLLFLLLNSYNIKGQNDLLNLKKYWYYHHRLVNDFMAKGDCQGCSEPMNERSFKWKETTDPTASVIAKWGDQTIALGHYISVLATEYKLLSDQNQPTDTTIQELYYAIKAVNRLDETAERIYAGSKNIPYTQSSSDLNGFFIRDDVPSTLLGDHPNLSNGVASNKKVTDVNSDYQACFEQQQPTTTFTMSHDQVWNLFIGFALVRKFLHPGITYQNKSLNSYTGNADIYEEALNITNRIMDFITTSNITTDWTIVNPVDGTHSAIGYQIKELSYGAAEAACFIQNPIINPSVKLFPVVHTCTDYHDATSYLDAPLWINFGKGIGNLIAISQEDIKLQQLAAIGNSWYSSAFVVIPNPVVIIKKLFDKNNLKHPFKYIKQIIQSPPIYPINNTATALGIRAILRDNQDLPLLRQVLHGGGNLVPVSTYRDMLNSAPCNGPRCYWNSNGECSPFEWSSSDRLHDAEERGGGSSQGEYCGLDYMLYYNLYHIIIPNTVPNVNYMDRVITFPFPTTGTFPVGTNATPAVIEAFNSITASNIVNSNANVTYRAGNQVTLLPGFIAKAGSNFRGYIDPFHCASDGSTYESPTHHDDPNNVNAGSLQSATFELLAYTGPTTSVYYPKTVNANANYMENIDSPASAQNNSLATTPVSKTTVVVSTNTMPVSSLSISPNPNNGSFTIGIQNIGKIPANINSKLTVYDLLGNVVLSKQLNDVYTTIDISNQPKGIYYIKIENAEGVKFEKVIYQ